MDKPPRQPDHGRIMATDQPSLEGQCRPLARRGFLAGLGALATGALAPRSAEAAAPLRLPSTRQINLVNANSGERVSGTYFENGHYVYGEVWKFAYVMRDLHVGRGVPMHPWLMDMAYLAHVYFRAPEVVALSGYRSPTTNARIEGAAKNSLHMAGCALDLRIKQADSLSVAQVLRHFTPGGVGWYPKRGFVHADVGKNRTWVG